MTIYDKFFCFNDHKCFFLIFSKGSSNKNILITALLMALKWFVYLSSGALSELMFVLHKDMLFQPSSIFDIEKYKSLTVEAESSLIVANRTARFCN